MSSVPLSVGSAARRVRCRRCSQAWNCWKKLVGINLEHSCTFFWLTPACRSSDLSIRSSSLSPRARIRSTFSVMMFFTPSTWSLKVCTLFSGSTCTPTPPCRQATGHKTQLSQEKDILILQKVFSSNFLKRGTEETNSPYDIKDLVDSGEEKCERLRGIEGWRNRGTGRWRDGEMEGWGDRARKRWRDGAPVRLPFVTCDGQTVTVLR